MENNIENIDDKFREASNVSDEKMNKLEMDNIWNKVEEKLDKKEGKKRTELKKLQRLRCNRPDATGHDFGIVRLHHRLHKRVVDHRLVR